MDFESSFVFLKWALIAMILGALGLGFLAGWLANR